MGITNCIVTNEKPESLAERFKGFFDRIVVDAPCSGEGMFRKEEQAALQWSPENISMCARRQGEILKEAAAMLRPGGTLIYSTCTFAPEENEGSISTFLDSYPEFSLKKVSVNKLFSKGRPEWIGARPETADTFRLWPHRLDGEGHFVAVLQKEGEMASRESSWKMQTVERSIWKLYKDFKKEFLHRELEGIPVLFGDQLYLLPEAFPLKGIKILRPGLHLGTVKKNRFEPSHALALCLNREQVKGVKAMEEEGPEIKAYLRGEVLRSDTGEKPYGDKGWVLMLAGSYSIGWSRQVGDTFKNGYPKGLRRRS